MDKAAEHKDLTVEQRLSALYDLQLLHSELDNISILRGELPLEVEDLEAEIEGLQTRINNLASEIDGFTDEINMLKNSIKDYNDKIKKYEADQSKVRNNREFEAITKETEFAQLEIQLAEKKIKGFEVKRKEKERMVESAREQLSERQTDLDHKRKELEDIVSETEKDEKDLRVRAKQYEGMIEERLLKAYKRIRKGANNGLAVVPIKRGACGGCFNKIPPQRQLDVQSRKKIIVCEHCGRILVDDQINEPVE